MAISYRFPRILPAVAVALWTSIHVHSASAQAPAAGAETLSNEATAQALFDEAVALAQAQEFTQAIEKFRASYDLDPALGTLLGLAMAEQEDGRLASALGHYESLRDLAARTHDDERLGIASRRIEKLGPRVPRLVLLAPGAVSRDTVISLDGQPLPAGALNSALPVNPGTHQIRAERPGFLPFQEVVRLEEAGRASIVISLRAVPAPPPPPPRRLEFPPRIPRVEPPRWNALMTTGLVMGGVGVVLGGVSAGLWINAGSTFNKLESGCQPNHECPPALVPLIERGRSDEILSRVALVVGGTALSTGIVLFFVGRSHTLPATMAISPTGVGVRGNF